MPEVLCSGLLAFLTFFVPSCPNFNAMKTTPRFETAVQKLYAAFHNDKLHPNCCKQCAVGTLLDHTDAWQHLSDDHGSLQLNYVGKVHEMMGRKFNGYRPSELLQIERAFLRGCGYQLPLRHNHFKPDPAGHHEALFEGLVATIQILCRLDGIADKMDISKMLQVPLKKAQITTI